MYNKGTISQIFLICIMSNQHFKKRVENFVCEHCETKVIGNGFTDHCSNCLWSKHVDVYPGDRSARCGGLMEPILIEQEPDRTVLTVRCERCGHAKRNKIIPEDSFEAVLALTKKIAGNVCKL